MRPRVRPLGPRRVPPARNTESASVNELVEKNIPLVEHIVRRVSAGFPSHFDRDDLVQAGLLGLTEAARNFDPTRGIAFSTFVGRRIEGAILDVLRKADWAPRSLRSSARALAHVEAGLTHSLGRVPNTDEISEEMGLSVAEITTLRHKVHKGHIDSLDRPIAHHEAGSWAVADTVADSADGPLEALEAGELHACLREAIRLLPERHRIVVVGYFFEGRSITQLGELLGVTQSRASQLKGAALKMIREAIDDQDRDPSAASSQTCKAAFAAAVAAHRTLEERLADRGTSSRSRMG